MGKKHCIRRWIIWSLTVLFYFYEYFLRVAPSVMQTELFRAFNISASMFGIISASYLYAYAPMQIPVGILMDRFGARSLLTFATVSCGISALLFGTAFNVSIIIISRIIMGSASAFAFIGMVYITSHWFEKKMAPLLIGIGNSIGMLGAVCGQGPLSQLIHIFSWRSTSLLLGGIGIALGIWIYLSVRNDPTSSPLQKPQRSLSLWEGIQLVCKNKQTWINGSVAMLFYTTTVSFGGLWAIPFLKQIKGFSNETASYAASMIYVGWIIAGPIVGKLAGHFNRKPLLLILTFLSTITLCMMIYLPITHPLIIFIGFIVLGCLLSGQLLCYSLAIDLNPQQAKGFSLAITNCLVFIAGSLIQTFVGIILDLNWKGGFLYSDRIYHAVDYHVALSCFPATLFLAFLLTLFIKEKHPNPIVSS